MFWGGHVVLNLATLPGWGATDVAAVVRPYKNFLIALNITKGAVNYPHMVKWSHRCLFLELSRQAGTPLTSRLMPANKT